MRGWRRAAEVVKAIGLCTALVILTACATTEYKVWEAKANVVEGNGGTKVMVDGMELWDNGEPPRKFTILGIIDDARPAGPIPMARLRGNMVKRARDAGGDALIQLNSQSHIAGTYTIGSGDGSRVVGGGARAPQRGQVRGHQVPRLGRPGGLRQGRPAFTALQEPWSLLSWSQQSQADARARPL
jgi:hypothetical protein